MSWRRVCHQHKSHIVLLFHKTRGGWFLPSLSVGAPFCFDHNRLARWSFFFQRWDGNIIFSGHHCHRWFSNGFVTFRPSPLNVFSQVNHLKQWFFDGFPNFGYDGYQWFRSWKKGNIVAFQTFEMLQQF